MLQDKRRGLRRLTSETAAPGCAGRGKALTHEMERYHEKQIDSNFSITACGDYACGVCREQANYNTEHGNGIKAGGCKSETRIDARNNAEAAQGTICDMELSKELGILQL